MRRPFWLIDGRLREADHFLDEIARSPSLDHARYSFSAFLATFTSIFDACDRTLRDVPGFVAWWNDKEEDLLTHSTVTYLWRTRNRLIHEGLNPLGRQTRGMFGSESFVEDDDAPIRNAAHLGRHAMALAVLLSADVYQEWWTTLDLPESYSTADLARDDKTLEMIELELGLPSGASRFRGGDEESRLAFLKDYSRTAMDILRTKYGQFDTDSIRACLRDESLRKTIVRRQKARMKATGDGDDPHMS